MRRFSEKLMDEIRELPEYKHLKQGIKYVKIWMKKKKLTENCPFNVLVHKGGYSSLCKWCENIFGICQNLFNHQNCPCKKFRVKKVITRVKKILKELEKE